MGSVLILTQPGDPHVSPIATEVRARGADVLCFNVADFPGQVVLQTVLASAGWSGTITYQGHATSLDSLTSIWWRRPERYKAPEIYTPGERAFLEEEANRGLIGVLESLTLHQTLWVSHAHRIRSAELKPLQLAIAQHLGLRVPRTMVTNDHAAARAFYETCHGNVILKAVSHGAIKDEERRFLYTSKIRPEHLSSLRGVQATAHLFQEYIPVCFNLRVVVIGQQIFAVELHVPQDEDAQIDFRRAYDRLTYRVHQLPEHLKAKVVALVRHFDLQFSSMDFLVTEEGDYIFIDLNPNGQFLWLQWHLHDQLPLKEAMANLLVHTEEYRL